ncbi:TonB-dependent siderophore receptor [Oceanospirillum sediminis]|uniref:TonB-dependent siderophore receptor n=1 Tax=Oceanospirillum sediminis TaxID=2760088 RepID=A0A839IW18_9GAMM|nr:TonB-dependent siderophore receptor [Oceanospirillum sediminis]MBB1489555.1 TonB-dependent siderophore receptor [Oceanospirillum sediminis]
MKHRPIVTAIRKVTQAAVLPAATLITLPASAQTTPAQEMEAITVVAEALKVDNSAQDTPRAVSIITREKLDAAAPQKLDEALRYTAGVTAQPYGSDNDTDWFKVRGMDAVTYLDGSRLFRDGYYTWLTEPYGLQQIEVIKGPAAILFGESSPGGIINTVQKKPTDNPQNEWYAQLGNKGLYSVNLDTSDALSDSMSYRLVGSVKSREGELDATENDRYYLAPSLKIALSDQTTLMLMATHLRDDGVPTNGFFPAAGTLLASDSGKIDPSTNYGEPDYDLYERTQVSVGYQLEHAFDDTWRFSQSLNYGYNDLLLRSTYAFFNADPAASQLYRGVVFREGDNQSVTFDNHAVGQWDLGRTEHTLLLGVDLQRHKTEGEEQDSYAFSPIAVSEPEYGHYTPLDPANNLDREITKSQASLYAQYQIDLDARWLALIGARYDHVTTENSSQAARQDKSRSDDELSFNTSVMYRADNGMSPYASYSQSFEVISTIDSATGELYKPLSGEQVEIGVKFEPDFMDGYINLAWFDITEKNALVTNPNTFVATQTGEETSTGMELDLVSQLSDSVKLSATYTYTKAETDNSYGQGKQQAGLIPEHAASAWLDYDGASAGVAALNIGLGARYIGKSKDNPASSHLTVPDVTLWDARVSYDINQRWNAQLNINNLFDKEYVSGCDYWCYYGQSRSVVFSTRYRW